MARVVEQPPIASIPYAKPPRNRQKNRALQQAAAVKALHSPKAPESSFVLVSSRAILPPLEVEVIAGNQRRALGASANSVNVKMQDGLAPAAAGQTQAAGTAREDAVERVQLSPGTERVVDSSVEPSYPMLAKQMKVQGAVILQTLISKAGTIDEIQVLSGPAILSAAAREAVRQWRFKPYLKGGQPVDSQARVTVNFTISTY
jgi:protein TonB